jgi:hypothetical protein
MVQIETIAYGGWQNCYRLSNHLIEMVIPGDIGFRVIRFGFVSGANEFFESEDDLGATGGDTWRFYGGHRLWHAPEDLTRTYIPDNSPVQVEQAGTMVRVTQPVEPLTHLQKIIEIEMSETEPQVTVTHRILNHGLFAVEFAPWALSVMRAGGTAILPLPPRGTHPENLVPSSNLTLWAYTDLSDPRWTFGQKYILLRQDVNATSPQKIGASVPDGWIAYANDGHLFVKQFEPQPFMNYPDMNSSVETFTNNLFLEIETLAPFQLTPPGGEAQHVEHWSLYDGIAVPRSDADVEANILSKIKG